MNNRNRYCGSGTFVGGSVDEEKGEISSSYLRADCQTYSCPTCGKKKVQRLRSAIIEKAIEMKLQRLLTLTLDPNKVEPESSIGYLRSTWGKFRTYLKRKFQKPVDFIAVVELQKSGMAHLHILVDRYISQEWISETWQKIGGGKIVHIQYVDLHRVAGYLTKYLTKDMLLSYHGKTKRYSTSRNIRLFPRKEGKVRWILRRQSITYLYSIFSPQTFGEQFDDAANLKFFKSNQLLS
ncbi:MAG TPA: hypothetical protein VES59_02770 [Bacteroidota bacterium]|nr:hypothetical protein [Bacteroidota bacterium]